LNNRTTTVSPEQLRRQAQEMLRCAEMEKTSVAKDTLRKQLTPALRDLLQAKHRTQKAVDELVDCVAELEGQVSQFETLVKEFTA
jgi:polyhydroxyalkanoate synthesis regulator phasin